MFLRNDIYELLVRETPDRDKDTAIALDWDDSSLFEELVRQRILATSELQGNFDQVWTSIAEPSVGSQYSFGFVVERTLMRPRDLLRFMHRSVEFAVNRGHERIQGNDFISAEKAFSEDLLTSTAFELGDVNRSMGDVLYCFIGCPIEMPVASVTALLTHGGIDASKHDETLRLLIWFGFLGVAPQSNRDPEYAYQVHYNLTKLLTILRTDLARLVVHPGFRSALGCDPSPTFQLPLQ